MSLLFAVLAILVIGGAVAYATGRWGSAGPEADRDLRPEVVDGRSTFDVVVRGYRMDEVDARIADLEQQVATLSDRNAGTPPSV